MRKDPLARAMRPDKVTMLGVARTLGLYRAGLATDQIPVWRMIAAPGGRSPGAGRCRRGADRLARVEPIELRSTIGGGLAAR